MSPIDDELRAALRGRADALAPAPDPLGGIETRARGIKRRRAGAAIAGAALAVAAIAVAVPTLTGSDTADDPSRLATVAPTGAPTTEPSVEPSVEPSAEPSAVPSAVPSAEPTPTVAGTAGPTVAQEPTNLLVWMARGNSALVDSDAVKTAFAHAMGYKGMVTSPDAFGYAPLYTGETDSGVRYTIGQAWLPNDPMAHTFGYATGGTNGPQVFLGPETPKGAQLVAFLVDSLPGTTTDLLVLVPRPGTGQLSYDTDGAGKLTPVAYGRSDLNGVGLVDRSTTTTNDRIEQLDGDGNTDHPIYRGPVAPFLCGNKECG